MKIRIAFAGFRHEHILGIYDLAGQCDDVEIAAACEEDAPTRERLELSGRVKLTYDSYDQMYRQVDFDVLAVGDYYARRGEIAIRALEAGKHVISDKPICTKLEQLDRITELVREKNLSVGCQLDLRSGGNFLALREVVRSGRIGEVHAIYFNGQHPLARSVRPEWYFQPGKQGGTINDISVHALDIIPWLTGRRIVSITSARAWNARLSDPDWFQDGAQLMLKLDNDGGVIGDVSYLTPENFAYNIPCYWRFTLHGDAGLAETSAVADGVTLYSNDSDSPQHVQPATAREAGHWEDFLNEVRGLSPRGGDKGEALTTADVLSASRAALLSQRAADENLHDLTCE